MKIINLETKNIFDLPKEDAEHLLKFSPNLFAKVGKNKKVVKNQTPIYPENSILSQILEK